MPIYQLVLPSMGESVSEATITQWLKKVGDTVAADEAVVEVATDKVDSEVASEYAGVIKEILHPVNAVVGVDAPLAVIETAEEVTQDVTPAAVQRQFLPQHHLLPRRLKKWRIALSNTWNKRKPWLILLHQLLKGKSGFIHLL
jgi:pyruvate/2-oxoglutarate dehydrogenase complex dihydrolipoamide acyltransferase (E2) component